MIFANLSLLVSAISVVLGVNPVTTSNPVPYWSVNSTLVTPSSAPIGTTGQKILELTIEGQSQNTDDTETYPLITGYVTRQPSPSNRIFLYFEFEWSNFLNLNANYYLYTNPITSNTSISGTTIELGQYSEGSYAFVYNDTLSDFTSLTFTFSLVWVNPDYVNDAYNQGYDNGNFDGYQQGYQTGKLDGYNLGLQEALANHDFTFTNLFASISDTPILMIRRLFGFEIFGTSVLAIFMSLFTALIVIKVIKRLI